MILIGKNIVIISNEPWSEIWFSKHHYAWELSKKGNKVFFVNPAPNWNLRSIIRTKIKTRKINENLTVIDYVNFLPSLFLTLNNRIVSKRISRHFLKFNIQNIIFWSFDPIRLFNPKLLNANLSIFHVMDKYQFVHPAEVKLHKNVDAFILVSATFQSQYDDYNKPMLILPHAISKDELILDENIDIKLPFCQNYFGCYVGNVDIRLDFDLIQKMASKFSDIPFLFVGSWKNVDDPLAIEIFEKGKFKNVYCIGPQPAKLLKYYINKSAFCIAPMSKTHLGNNISHHKIFQYLAWGKAIFSIDFLEYRNFRDLLYMEDDSDKLLSKMSSFIQSGESNELVKNRILHTNEFTFEKHFLKIENFLTKIEKG